MKRTIIFLATAVFVLGAAPMFAQTASDNLDVSATVAARCTIVANPLAFGAYDTFTGAPVNGATTLTVRCTKNNGTSLTLDAGSNGAAVAGSDRAMALGGIFLGYDLFEDSGRTTKWTGALTTFTAAGNSSAQTINVYGRVAASQDVPAGTYTDTVVATVNW